MWWLRRLRRKLVAENYRDPAGPRYGGDQHARPREPRDHLEVITFNLRYAIEVGKAIHALSTFDPDVVLMQEMDAAATESIAHALGMAWVYYPGSAHTNGKDFGNAILTPWPIVSDRKLITPHGDRHDGRRRPGTLAVIDHPRRRFTAVSMHTSVPPVPVAACLEQAEPAFTAPAGPAVVGGDFNTRTPAHVDGLRALATRDGFANAIPGVTATRGPGLWDHIFTRGFSVQSAGTYDGDAGSDHQPTWSRLGL